MSLNSKKSLESLNSLLKMSKPYYYKSITSNLHIARRKLLPIINEILKTASENSSKTSNQSSTYYYITLDQYSEVMGAVQLLKEVDAALRNNSSKNEFEKLFKQSNFNFDSKIKVNESGKIYIDAAVLNQLIDLHNLLGDIIDFIHELVQEGDQFFDSNEEVATLNNISSDSFKENQQVRVEKITREILTCLTLPLKTDYTVMTSTDVNSYQENGRRSKSNSEGERKDSSTYTQKEHAINAAGAKKIIIKCIADLDKVRNFLEKDISMHSVNVEKYKSQHLNVEHESVNSLLTENDLKDNCHCLKCCPTEQPLEFTWKENGETGSKLVICIKGKSEEDGDIHVVIRQCPECLNSKTYETDETEPVHDTDQPTLETHQNSTTDRSSRGRNSTGRNSTGRNSRDRNSTERPLKDPHKVARKPSPPESDDHQHINVIFDPDNPSLSVVEGPNIRLNDTINLNLVTSECNQDLVITLCVKPKGTKSKPGLNIDDIFNDSQASLSKSKTSLGIPDQNEKVYPIFRTKICSSMEMDVHAVKSKLHTRCLQHHNAEVRSRLKDIGVDNILRASRPAKCGRMAVLDEYSCKNLPYSPSLRSLPLNNRDIKFVNQSLNMSVNKIKRSTIYVGESK